MALRSEVVSGTDLWPIEEARHLLERVRDYPASRPIIFEGGFGPSGLPHLGTIGEVLRPSYVRKALNRLDPSRATRLIVFIDDMDGLRKVPETLINRDLERHLGKPVSRIPDPFDDGHRSFSDHMVSLLGDFLKPVEVDYEIINSSQAYGGGLFDDGLRRVMDRHEEISALIRPTLRAENRAGWSPFMPICPSCGQVNSTRVTAYHRERVTVEFACERSFGGSHGCGFRGEQSVLGGNAKVQWKVDWALRWYVLGVDYELYGKDLIDSARLSGEIVRLLGGQPPMGFAFEMYLDEAGHKVSKSVGRGVGVEQWLRYAPIEVLKYFLILNPRKARKLFLEAIPQYVDEYLDALRARDSQEDGRGDNLLDFVLQSTSVRHFRSDLTYAMILNLVSALGNADSDLVMNYLRSYDPRLTSDAATAKLTSELVGFAIRYFTDFIAPTKQSYKPTDQEKEMLAELKEFLVREPAADAESIERKIYEIGRANYDKPGKIFPLLYRVILQQDRGPRLGSFVRLLSPPRVAALIQRALG
jgi:lysyl-tRNA synthetase class 1